MTLSKQQISNLRRNYGLGLDDYERMLEEQRYVCAICANPPAAGGRLAVDHCHKTGFVRGLLCVTCNVGLGSFKDSPARMVAAIEYLRRPRAESWEEIAKQILISDEGFDL